MDILKAPKGTRDLTGSEGQAFTQLEQIARHVFGLFHFSEIRIPIFESVDLFSRSLGDTSDVVQKEMFTFEDRGERTFALRPEGTAGVVRHFIENKLSVKGGIHRFFYMGPMFRAERPQAGRYRQFWQIGSEYFGSAEPAVDSDTILMVAKIISEFGIKDFEIQINSIGCKTCRPKHREALLTYLKKKEKDLTKESKERMAKNPLRVLDSKVDGPKLTDAPAMKDYLCEDCKTHYATVQALLNKAGQKFKENPRLVRGLDYYTRTVFEVTSSALGAQNALAAGGRYDDLVEHLGGPATPGIGFALGMDRLVTARKEAKDQQNGFKTAVVIPLDEAAVPAAFSLQQDLRKNDISSPPLTSKRKLKSQLSSAVDLGARWAVLIGEDELKKDSVTVKNLETRKQESLKRAELVKYLQDSN